MKLKPLFDIESAKDKFLLLKILHLNFVSGIKFFVYDVIVLQARFKNIDVIVRVFQ